MSWRDRNYSYGSGAGDYLGNPASILGLSVPFGTWLGVRVRLHFWMLLAIVFIAVDQMRIGQPIWIPVYVAMFIAAVLIHEFGHRVAASIVGGTHDEFILWPAGGLVPPNAPMSPWPYFVTHFGGIAANLLVVILCGLGAYLVDRSILPIPLNPIAILGGGVPVLPLGLNASAFLLVFAMLNVAVVGAAILPYYWFDGAPILQSILWPWTGLHQAINVTCIVGMVLAVPMFLLSVLGANLMGMIFWVLLFASSYTRRRQLQAEGAYEMDATIAASASYREPRSSRRRKSGPSLLTKWTQQRKATNEQQLQQQVDAILEKVSQQGMHSLSEKEKRILKKASEDLRDERK